MEACLGIYVSQYALDALCLALCQAICTFTFDENTVLKDANTLFEIRYSKYIGIRPQTARICYLHIYIYIYIYVYVYVDQQPRSVCNTKKYNQHLHIYLTRAQFFNHTKQVQNVMSFLC